MSGEQLPSILDAVSRVSKAMQAVGIDADESTGS